jgi:solute carrier family 25 citrate transporter 1
MAVRFSSFEQFKLVLNVEERGLAAVFVSGIMAGITEAVLVVTPVETCKIRLQGQYNSMVDPVEMAQRKYHNVFQAGLTIVKEEGFGALYKGVLPTIMRQASNQGVNFTCYQIFKEKWLEISGKKELAPWQHLMIGGMSGGMGPCANCPLDVVKTRLQKQVVKPGQTPKYTGILQAIPLIAEEEGPKALWKGLSPRLMRIMPGQAITFTVYERVSKHINE